MPFDFKEYQTKCDGMSTEEIHKEIENYTRQLSGGATSTATSILLAPYTGGVSLVGLGLSTPKIHNARKKKAILEAGLKARGATHNTRKRDVLAPVAVTGAINGLTMGLAGPIAGTVAGQVVGHGVEYAATHVALDAGGSLIEHEHGKHQKLKAEEKLQAQYANFKIQFAHEQASVQGVQSPVGYQLGPQTPASTQGYQPASPLTQNNLPGPPPLPPQRFPPNQKSEPMVIPASYDTRPQQTITQHQTTFYAGASLQFQSQHTSYQQNNVSAQQPSSSQPQPNSSPQQLGLPIDYPPRPLIMADPSTTTTGQMSQPALQHRPSLPTPAVTPHTTFHRPSLPTSAPAAAPQAPTSPVSTLNSTTTAQTEAMRSMEEEITLLRLQVLAMTMEKRGEKVKLAVEECEEDDEDDEHENDEEKPKSPEIPETFPVEAWAPEPIRKTTKDAKTVASPAVESQATASSPKLNVFVDVQQPQPQHIITPLQVFSPQTTVPYPTFSTPQPERQHYQPPQPQYAAPPTASSTKQEGSKTSLSIAGGISISVNRNSVQTQASPAINMQNAVPRPASVPPPQHSQPSNPNQGNSMPQQQSSPYQTYNPHQRAPSIPTSPQQQVAPGAMVPYKPAPPPQQSNTGLQIYNPAQQAPPPPSNQYPVTYPQPTKQAPPLQHQDSGYYSNPSSRHSSTFSFSANASLNMSHSQQSVSSAPSFPPPNAQPGSPQQYIPATNPPYGQMPTTYTPSPMSPPAQQYFPPPPANAPPPNKDYFGQNNRVSTPNPQAQGYQPAPLALPASNYGNGQNGQNLGNRNQGWQWGNANAGAPGEPNYGPPPPIPGQWRGS